MPLPQQSGSLCIIARERERESSERRDEEEARLIVRNDPEIRNMMKRGRVAAAAEEEEGKVGRREIDYAERQSRLEFRGSVACTLPAPATMHKR